MHLYGLAFFIIFICLFLFYLYFFSFLQVISLFARHFRTGEPLPMEAITKYCKASNMFSATVSIKSISLEIGSIEIAGQLGSSFFLYVFHHYQFMRYFKLLYVCFLQNLHVNLNIELSCMSTNMQKNKLPEARRQKIASPDTLLHPCCK